MTHLNSFGESRGKSYKESKISDSIKGFDKLKTRREKLNAVMNYEHTKGLLSKSRALTKAKQK